MARGVLRFTISTFIIAVLLGAADGAQRRTALGHPAHLPPAQTVHGHVFIGGYFYDPFFGPYPWWPQTAYPHVYVPVFDTQAGLRLHVQPEAATRAAVYVDGFHAGVVDDFNGIFQGLPLTPGGHRIVLYLDGYRTTTHNIYFSPGTTFQLRATLERLPGSETSQPPETAPPVPPPPAGTYRSPLTPAPNSAPATPFAHDASGFGTLDIYVQPTSAEVTIDGHRWATSEDGHYVVRLPSGRHRVEMIEPGYQQFTIGFVLEQGKEVPLSIRLPSVPSEPSSGGPRP